MQVAALLLLLLVAVPAAAGDKWDNVDKGLAVAALALKVVDFGQTRYIAAEGLEEYNPVMRRHPSVDEVGYYFVASTVIELVVAHALPSKWRKVWLAGWVGTSGAAVVHNTSAGIGMRW